MILNITIAPLGRGRFAARLGDQLLCESRHPFFSAARVLVSDGYSPEDDVLVMRYDGSESVAMRWRLGLAARLTVRETETTGPVFETYRDRLDTSPFPGARHRTPETEAAALDDLSDKPGAVAPTPGRGSGSPPINAGSNQRSTPPGSFQISGKGSHVNHRENRF